MQAPDIQRLVVISAAPVSTVPSPSRPKPPRHDPGDGFFMRHLVAPLLKATLRERYADLNLMEDVVRESGLDHHPTATADRQAVKLAGYAARSQRRPEALQQTLFYYLEAL